KLADVLQLPGAKQPEPEITVGEMWEDYLVWKETQVEPSTFCAAFKTYTNIIKGLKGNRKTRAFDDTGLGIWDSPINEESGKKIIQAPFCKTYVIGAIQALNEAFTRSKQLGKFSLPDVNPFFELHKEIGSNSKQKYQSTLGEDGETIEWWQVQDANEDELESDRRAFTKEERDIIIRAFYESDKVNERSAAPLIEFMFLTGCRPGEAFALRWGDIKWDKEIIRFSKSYASRIRQTQQTKTKTIRMFPMSSRLVNLLLRVKPETIDKADLVFQQTRGQSYHTIQVGNLWTGYTSSSNKNNAKTYHYPGVVTRLVEQSKISGYLPPYHTRHTYITLTAHANKSNASALLLLAHACGNSPEVIMKHYLDVDHEVQLVEV
ncbi:site-specific integrase, partial [Microcoleus sp. B5-D4]|uniref:site-specific integrase n=1 Tax=unclassified Microcoleus TaxID=2642155 RepID=UPI002FD60AC2